ERLPIRGEHHSNRSPPCSLARITAPGLGHGARRTVAELDGARVARAAVDRLEDRLAGSHACQATRADLLRRLGRRPESRAAYNKSIEMASNTAETAYLRRRRGQPT